MQDLADVLQRERGLLEQLRYRLVALELLTEAREARFLGWATQDVTHARRLVRETDLSRAAEVGRLGVKGARGLPSLREVAAVARPPWSGIFRDHHDSLCALVAEIELHGHHIAQRARDGLADLAHHGTWVPAPHAPEGDLVGPTTAGAPTATAVAVARTVAPGQPEDLDAGSVEVVLNEVIAGSGRLRIPSLLAFLR